MFGEPLKGETLQDVDGKTYTNQIGVKGLYYDGIMDATVAIDYEAMTARVGMFLDARSTAGQLHNSGKLADYPYVCFLPGMGTTTPKSLWATPWNFVQPDLSTTDTADYTWLWFTVSSDFTTLNYSPNSSAGLQYLNTDAKTTANAILRSLWPCPSQLTSALRMSVQTGMLFIRATSSTITMALLSSRSSYEYASVPLLKRK